MSVTVLQTGFRRRSVGRRGIAAAVAIAVAGALAVATWSNPRLAGAVEKGIGEGVDGMKTVAAMLAERSPGQRPEGALANLKPKRHAVLHERALPKVRQPTAFETLAGPPPAPPVVPPVEGPLYNTVAGSPETPVVPVTGGTPGGPPVLADIPPPGGGGGGGFSPPVVQSTPESPPVPVSPVPEPQSWAMMLLGFLLLGQTIQRGRAARPKSASA